MVINATLCYIRQNRKTLMLYRNKKPDDIHKAKWNGLGGKLEPGETPEECAIREVIEESGLSIIDPQLKGILTFPNFDNENDWIVFVYLIHDAKGDLIESSEGQLAWIDNDKLLDLPLWEGDKIFLPWLDQHKFFSGKFTYVTGHLVDHKVTFYT